MAKPEHLDKLKVSVEVWNEWRHENIGIVPALLGADLEEADLRGADLGGASLCYADFGKADLKRANLKGANQYYIIRGLLFIHVYRKDTKNSGRYNLR